MTRRRGDYRKRYTAFAAICGLICQLVLTSLAIPAAFAAARTGALPAGYTTIVICTGSGLKRITLDAAGNAIEEQDSENGALHCTACPLAGGTLLSPVNATQLTAPEYTALQRTPRPARTASSTNARLCPDSRAPPAKL
ncbi:MAG: hypothetical protein OEM91_15195 [Hyphomicrobiales bacterium]|nr:hypothetical protein [Hyphomicrobiales bacterium]